MARFCGRCGALMSDDERTCPECGSAGRRSKVPLTSAERKGIRKAKVISAIVAVSLVILGLVFFSIVLG